DKIQQKWTNIRDAFIRSLRVKSGQPHKRSYIYGEHMKFLLAVATPNEDKENSPLQPTSSQCTSLQDDETQDDMQDDSFSTTPDRHPRDKLRKATRPKRNIEDIEAEIIEELKRPRTE
ncbi:hypothetical protein JTE90_018413, partial [Oedothorax gibbosus]